MIKTATPVSHQGFTVYGAASSSTAPAQNTNSSPTCFLWLVGDTGCPIDKSKWKDWVGAQGVVQIGKDTGESILTYSKANKDFATGTDKIVLLMPFIVLMLGLGMAIGFSKGRYPRIV